MLLFCRSKKVPLQTLVLDLPNRVYSKNDQRRTEMARYFWWTFSSDIESRISSWGRICNVTNSGVSRSIALPPNLYGVTLYQWFRWVRYSNFFIIFCCSRPFLWPPKGTSTQHRFSTLHSPPPSKGYTTKDDSHQRLYDDTHQKVSQPMMTLLDVTYFLVFKGILTNIFCIQRKKRNNKILWNN